MNKNSKKFRVKNNEDNRRLLAQKFMMAYCYDPLNIYLLARDLLMEKFQKQPKVFKSEWLNLIVHKNY